MADIPFVGCGVLASSSCMDKAVTHALLHNAGVKQAKWLTFLKHDYYESKECSLQKIADELKFPCFVKPANAGSSVGITKATDLSSLEKGMDIAFKEDKKVVVEENIIAKEIECAVLGNEAPIASCLGEIVPVKDFYDYEAKYVNGTTKTYAPARIDDATSDKIRNAAIEAYKILGCEGFTRIDFFLKDDGTIILNEPNTIPGFTSISMYPQLFIKSGIPYSDLIDKLIEFAILKNKAGEE